LSFNYALPPEKPVFYGYFSVIDQFFNEQKI